jgi:hypothetical protein
MRKLHAALLAGGLFVAGGTAQADVILNIGGPAEIKYNGVTTEDFAGTYGNESTFGVGYVTTIQKIGGGSPFLFVDNLVPTGERLFFVLYGMADAQISPAGPGVNIWNEGCTGGPCDGKIHIDFYAVPNGSIDPRELANTNRTAFDAFTGITDIGTAIMKWTLDTGAAPNAGDGGYDESTSQLFQTATSATLPATGVGNFFASCVSFVGADECGQFDTNFFTTHSGVQSDFLGLFDLRERDPILNPEVDASWDGLIHDPVIARAIPEPTTLGLLGLATLGFGFLARRRKAA